MIKNIKNPIQCFLLLIFAGIIIFSCNSKKEETVFQPKLPYPDLKNAQYLQSRVDSSEFEWFLDVKGTVSVFCNEQIYSGKDISTDDVIILTESLFHAKAEVQLPLKTVIITLDRPFKERGDKSIWQVTGMEISDGKKTGTNK
jgi:hypothetical protein